jgi:hypothetical protein
MEDYISQLEGDIFSFIFMADAPHHGSKLIPCKKTERRCQPRMLRIKEPADCK